MAEKARILLLEHNPGDAFLVHEALRAQGISYELVCYNKAAHVFRDLFELAGPLPQAVLLDFHLPCDGGCQVLKAMRSSPRSQHVPVGVLAAYWKRESAMQLGADLVIEKPMDLDQFLNTVGRAVRTLLHSGLHADSLGAGSTAG